MRSRFRFNERAQLWFRLEQGDLLGNKEVLVHRVASPGILASKTEEGWWVVGAAGEFLPGPDEFNRCSTLWDDRPEDVFALMSAWYSKQLVGLWRLGGDKLVEVGAYGHESNRAYHFPPRLFLFPIEEVPLDLVMASARMASGSQKGSEDYYLELGLRGRLELNI
jgi:hypothetical protein